MDSAQLQQENLTPRQLQLLKVISAHLKTNCFSPTISELAKQLHLSRSTIFEHIEELRKKGYLQFTAGKARSLKPAAEAFELLESLSAKDSTGIPKGIPLVGRVAAGLPIEAIETREYISVENVFGNTGEIFALEVTGQSMIDDGIRDGDFVICKRTKIADNGQMVIAIVDDDNATIKRFFKEKDAVRLQPANDEYQPIFSNSCRIEAVIIGLVRKL